MGRIHKKNTWIMIESKDVTWNFSSIFSCKTLCKSFITMSTFTDKNARKLKGIWYDVFPQLTRFMLHALHPLDLMFYIDISPNITFYKWYCCCVIICVVCPFPPLRNTFFFTNGTFQKYCYVILWIYLNLAYIYWIYTQFLRNM